MPYPFNITMRPETLAKVIFDALESCIVQGIDRLLIVNGHGGNNSAIDVALTWLRREHPGRKWQSRMPGGYQGLAFALRGRSAAKTAWATPAKPKPLQGSQSCLN